MKKRKKEDEWEDDGRVIANMYVDGMPDTLSKHGARRKFDEFGQVRKRPEPIELTKDEKRAIGKGAGLAVAFGLLAFAAIFGLFIWFCTAVWFK